MNIQKAIAICLLSTATLSIAEISLSREQPLLLAQNNRLPKVGTVESKESGAGCYYWLPGQSKKSIFVNVGASPLMNFDSRDTILTKVSDRSKGKTSTTIYKAGDLTIQIDARSTSNYTDSPNIKATIKLTQNGRSKVIKAIGYCGC
jgi:hypothetical protein